MDKKDLLDFIKKQKLAVISTISSQGDPQAAVIEFGENDNLELIFDTFNTARKYKNLKKNNKVALVIGWDENITVQYEGDAFEIAGEELKKYKELYFKKNPAAKRWEKFSEMAYFKVKPTWVRYSDLRKHPWEVVEITDF